MRNRNILILCFLSLYMLAGQAQNLSFNHLTTDDGLSHNSVVSIYQDERGFLWFATHNGISLYNGKDFKIYQKEKENPKNSILYNDIYQITGDRKGHIYIMTNRGVSAYDIQSDQFSHLTTQNIQAEFFADSLYIATSDQIFKYNGERLRPIYKMPAGKGYIKRLYVHNDSIMIGTDRGVCVLTPQKQLNRLISQGNIVDIFRDSHGSYWIAARTGQGAYRITGQEITNFVHDKENPASISSSFVHRFCEDLQGNVWIGTFNGLNKYDRKTGTFHRYNKQENQKSLSYSSIWSLFCDRQGTIWAGTYFGGVNYFHPQKQIFREYQASPNESEGLSSPIVSRITEDDKGNLWIGTEGGGVNRYNAETQTYKRYTLDNIPGGTAQNNIKAIYYDAQRETLWLGVHMAGLYKLNTQTGNITPYKRRQGDKHSILSNSIESILPHQGKLLLATNNGICVFDPETGKSQPFFKDPNIHSRTLYSTGLVWDHKGILWITGNNNGVYAYHPDTDKLTVYRANHAHKRSISSNSVNSIFEDGQQRLWLCTNENGLDLYRRETDDFENFDVQNSGLASNVVYNICELSADRLLVTTDKGFSILDYKQKVFKNYSQLPLSCLNENALYKSRNGEIFIGGTSGAISFYEEDLEQTPRSYNILPSRLTINGKAVSVADESGVLEQDISFTKSITLKAGQDIFSIEYAITDYLPFNKDDIVYQLEGFSNTWNKLEQNTITYSNLSPGKYTLVVRAENTDRKYAKLHQITFSFEKSSDDIRAWYDAKQMQKVMNNLISNAFKHTKNNGHISISVRKRNQEIIIEVTDTGSGIAARDIDRIFDRFFQAEQLDSLSNASTGIGLALTKGIIELHHGSIEVSSEQGEGSTFRIHLKTGNEHFNTEQIDERKQHELHADIDQVNYNHWKAFLNKQEITNQTTEEEKKKEKHKILIVEDNDSLRNMLIGIFETFYTVVIATNGKEGLEKIRSEMPDIVLSDIVMPEMSGTELCQILKKDFAICHIPVVLLTAKTAIEYNMEGLRMGADDYITKPFNINLLLSRCNNLVNNRIMLQEKFSQQPQTNMQILATNAMDKKFLDKAMEIFEKEIENADFNVDQWAIKMGIARTKLFTKLKAISGQTPGEIMMTIRLKKAAHLLRNNPELNIAEVSDKSGFNIPKYFSKCFKERYHITPQAYRKGNEAPLEEKEER